MVVILCCVGAPPHEDGAEVVGLKWWAPWFRALSLQDP